MVSARLGGAATSSPTLGAMIRTFRHGEFDAPSPRRGQGPAGRLGVPARPQRGSDRRPHRRGAPHAELVDVSLVDEIVVIDDHSSDRTADIAAAAGAKVYEAESILAEYGEGHGKGEAMWKSLFVSSGDLIVWCDADVRDFDTDYVVGLLGPLLTCPDVQFVKGFYDRPIGATATAAAGHRTRRPAGAVAVVPAPRPHRAAPRRRVRRPA